MQLQVTKTFQLFDKDIIEKYKDETGWFDGMPPISRVMMYESLMSNMGFSREQSLIVIAALGLVGVIFDDDIIEIREEI